MLTVLNKYILTTCLDKDISYSYSAILFKEFYDNYNKDFIFKWEVNVRGHKTEIFYISLMGGSLNKEWRAMILI
jgi:uncharacterized protein YbcV (DUF1398 family)